MISANFFRYEVWNEFEIKKYVIVLGHENYDKLPNVIPAQYFCSGFDHANLVNSFRGTKYLPKITFSNV